MLARKWLDEEPNSADAALYLINALKAPATPDAYRSALEEYAALERRLERESGRLPSHEVARLAATIREELTRLPVGSELADSPAVTPPSATSPLAIAGATAVIEGHRLHDRAPLRTRVTAIPLATLLLVASTSFTSHAARPGPADTGRPSVAVVDIRNISHDSRTAWLELGLPKLVSSDIARSSSVEVVSLEAVRTAREVLGLRPGAALRPTDIVELGAQSGADWVASGGVRRTDSLYVLEMTVLSTKGAGPPQRFTLASSSLLALADQAAMKLTSATTGHSRGKPGSPTVNVLAGARLPEWEPAPLRARR